jgi:hypothetical protein
MRPRPGKDDLASRRAAVRRTALILAAVALAIFGAFILSGALGRQL